MNKWQSMGLKSIFASGVAFLAIGAARAQTSSTFTDGTFALANWQTGLYHDGASTSSASQMTSGGNPGAYRQIVNQDANDNMNAYSFLMSATVSPSAGAITSVSGSFDIQNVGAWGQGVSLALVQGGVDYEIDENTDYPFSWEHLTWSGLTAASFYKINDPSLHPDFSTAGAPITFGFVVGNSTGYGIRTTTTDIDNYSITINQSATAAASAPEPGSVALLFSAVMPATGATALLRRRRRNPAAPH